MRLRWGNIIVSVTKNILSRSLILAVVIVVNMLTANQMPGFTAGYDVNNGVFDHVVVEGYIGLWNNGHKLM